MAKVKRLILKIICSIKHYQFNFKSFSYNFIAILIAAVIIFSFLFEILLYKQNDSTDKKEIAENFNTIKFQNNEYSLNYLSTNIDGDKIINKLIIEPVYAFKVFNFDAEKFRIIYGSIEPKQIKNYQSFQEETIIDTLLNLKLITKKGIDTIIDYSYANIKSLRDSIIEKCILIAKYSSKEELKKIQMRIGIPENKADGVFGDVTYSTYKNYLFNIINKNFFHDNTLDSLINLSIKNDKMLYDKYNTSSDVEFKKQIESDGFDIQKFVEENNILIKIIQISFVLIFITLLVFKSKLLTKKNVVSLIPQNYDKAIQTLESLIYELITKNNLDKDIGIPKTHSIFNYSNSIRLHQLSVIHEGIESILEEYRNKSINNRNEDFLNRSSNVFNQCMEIRKELLKTCLISHSKYEDLYFKHSDMGLYNYLLKELPDQISELSFEYISYFKDSKLSNLIERSIEVDRFNKEVNILGNNHSQFEFEQIRELFQHLNRILKNDKIVGKADVFICGLNATFREIVEFLNKDRLKINIKNENIHISISELKRIKELLHDGEKYKEFIDILDRYEFNNENIRILESFREEVNSLSVHNNLNEILLYYHNILNDYNVIKKDLIELNSSLIANEYGENYLESDNSNSFNLETLSKDWNDNHNNLSLISRFLNKYIPYRSNIIPVQFIKTLVDSYEDLHIQVKEYKSNLSKIELPSEGNLKDRMKSYREMETTLNTLKKYGTNNFIIIDKYIKLIKTIERLEQDQESYAELQNLFKHIVIRYGSKGIELRSKESTIKSHNLFQFLIENAFLLHDIIATYYNQDSKEGKKFFDDRQIEKCRRNIEYFMNPKPFNEVILEYNRTNISSPIIDEIINIAVANKVKEIKPLIIGYKIPDNCLY